MANQVSHGWAENADMVDFYSQHRNNYKELYPSEKRFLPWLAQQSTSVLDVGCAAGGFSNIWHHYNPRIHYNGVDLSTTMTEYARKVHPQDNYLVGDCPEGLPLPAGYCTTVAALGWLHWEPKRNFKAIREMWRLAEKYLFYDLRLVARVEDETSIQQRLEFDGHWDGHTYMAYSTVGWPRLAETLLQLEPAQILATGYWGKPAHIEGVTHQVCFATLVLEKRSAATSAGKTAVCLDLPLEWPAQYSSQVKLLPKENLERIAPPVNDA